MKQSALCRAVARATGESVRQIRRLGFGLLRSPHRSRRPKPPAGPAILPRPTATVEPVAVQFRAAA